MQAERMKKPVTVNATLNETVFDALPAHGGPGLRRDDAGTRDEVPDLQKEPGSE